MSTFKFGEIRADVRKIGPGPENLEVYAVKLSAPQEDSWIESQVVGPKVTRSSGTDFAMAAQVLATMKMAADDPKLWYLRMMQIGHVSPEELRATIEMAERLSPYLEDAVLNAHERLSLYNEYWEGRPGPLEMGIARVLQLPDRIRRPEDIAQFFAYLYIIDNTYFHPDDSFEGYVGPGGKRAYTDAEARKLNKLMAEAFTTSQKYGLDIYGLGLQVAALTGRIPNPEYEAEAPAWLKALSNTWI